jgi:hypothetical protein
MVYGITINATDVNNAATSVSPQPSLYDHAPNHSFDTVVPAYTFEAADWNFNSGQFIDNPQTNAYLGNTTAVAGTDYVFNGGSGQNAYSRGGISTEPLRSGDIGRPDRNNKSYNPGGEFYFSYDVAPASLNTWANYTRTIPAGTYAIFARVASVSSSANVGKISLVADATIPSQSVTDVGTFNTAPTGTGFFVWRPVTNSLGALAQFTSTGAPMTLRYTTTTADQNYVEFFMLIPVPFVEPPPPLTNPPTILNVFPDGSLQFQTNLLTFGVSSTVAVDSVNGISVTLNGTSLVTGANTSQEFTNGNGLVLTGSSTNWSVSLPLATNMLYSGTINAVNTNGAGSSYSLANFDTIVPAYTFEAADWNYNSGQYIDNPQTNAYLGITTAVPGVDYVFNGGSGSDAYARGGISTEPLRSGDVGRPDRNNKTYNPGGEFYFSYDVAPASLNTWANYTRTIPAGTYNMFVRVSGFSATTAGKISLVDDATTSNQNLLDLGTFRTLPTGASYFGWRPVTNSLGALAQFTSTGAPMTLRYTTMTADLNYVEFFMLIPTDPAPPAAPSLSNFNPPPSDTTSGGMFSGNISQFSFNAQTSVGFGAGGIQVVLNGSNVTSGLSFVASTNTFFGVITYAVTGLMPSNSLNTAIVTMTDSVGTTVSTNKFDSFIPSLYMVEAEDFDYNSGQFFDSGINAYDSLGFVVGVDAQGTSASNGAYRPDSSGNSVAIEYGGDTSRSGHSPDYAVGSNLGGNWANYTRTYPAGTYNVYMRAASPTPYTGDDAKLSLVTAGVGTSSQTVADLGVFPRTYSPDWDKFDWTPLVDSNGDLVKVPFTGTTNTLRVTSINGAYNANFYLFVPTTPAALVVNPPTITSPQFSDGSLIFAFLSQSGVNYQMLCKTNLTDAVWTPVGAVIPGTGLTITVTNATDAATGFYRLQAN